MKAPRIGLAVRVKDPVTLGGLVALARPFTAPLSRWECSPTVPPLDEASHHTIYLATDSRNHAGTTHAGTAEPI